MLSRYVAQLPNDECASAADISIGESISGSTVDASVDHDASSADRECGSPTAIGQSSDAPVAASGGLWYRLKGTMDQ